MKAVFTEKAIAQLQAIDSKAKRQGIEADVRQLLNTVEAIAMHPEKLAFAPSVSLVGQVFDKVYLVGEGNVRALVAEDSKETLVVANVYEHHRDKKKKSQATTKWFSSALVTHPLRHPSLPDIPTIITDNHVSTNHHRKS